MTGPKLETELAPLRTSVKEQGDFIKKLKADGAPEVDVMKAMTELKKRQKLLEEMELSFIPDSATFDRARMDDLLKHKFFFDQSFAIYGGITGQYDYGPLGCAVETNILNAWRNFFILKENMLEVRCSILTPEPVLKASGHVERFADLMVKDLKNGECFRLDHLIKAHLEKLCSDKKTTEDVRKECEDIVIKLDGMSKEEMGAVLKKYNIKSPITGNDLTEPIDFNLMFSTQIGPTGLIKGFLRPETAQGIFVNFKKLLDFNEDKLPFAAAQIGSSFRNEISPRSRLIRVREFTMAEIEHFCDPDDKSHPKFKLVKDTNMLLYSACNQMDGNSAEVLPIGKAVATGLVANETLGYFLARIQEFLIMIGVDPSKLRFRQHMANEMAHYACDCWDAELLTSYGWVECVGCADRSAYDLTQHTKATGVKLVAQRNLSQPKIDNISEADPNKNLIGKTFRKEAKVILDALATLEEKDIDVLEKDFNEKGEYELKTPNASFKITKDMVAIKKYEKTVHVEEFVPSVIEPSFGIGRIMYSVFEHNFKMREGDEQRRYFSLPALIAPVKCSVLPLSRNTEFTPFVVKLSHELTKLGVTHKIDESSTSIGRRYARTDEIAIPFGITIDFDTLKVPHSATLRERDSMSQVRIPVDRLPGVVSDLSLGKLKWSQVELNYPTFVKNNMTPMTDPKIENELAPLRASVKEQGSFVNKLKADGASTTDILQAVDELQIRLSTLESRTNDLLELNSKNKRFIIDCILKTFYFKTELVGGITGEPKLNPLGIALRNKVHQFWCDTFFLKEEIIMYPVMNVTTQLKSCGHNIKSNDWIVKDKSNGTFFKIDRVIEFWLRKSNLDIESQDQKKKILSDMLASNDVDVVQISSMLEEYKIKSPITGQILTEPQKFINTCGLRVSKFGMILSQLRPASTENIFANLHKIMKNHCNRLPLGIGNIDSVSSDYRYSLCRFNLAARIVVVFDLAAPHENFEIVKDTTMLLYSACNQMDGKSAEVLPIGEAVTTGLVANETLGYFMARIQNFLITIGVDSNKLRFRQHMTHDTADECNCWSVELFTPEGWVIAITFENNYGKNGVPFCSPSGNKLLAKRILRPPKIILISQAVPNKSLIGKTFRKEAKIIFDALAALEEKDIDVLEKDFNEKGEYELKTPNASFKITKDMVVIKRHEKTLYEEVFELFWFKIHFDLLNIVSTILFHNFKFRDGSDKCYFSLPSVICPIVCKILSINTHVECLSAMEKIKIDLRKEEIAVNTDIYTETNKLDYLYETNDVNAVRFTVVLDDTFKASRSAILRDRDSMDKVRINVDRVPGVVRDLLAGKMKWTDVEQKYSKVEQ